MATDELQAVEHEITEVTAHLAQLKKRAAQLKEQVRLSGLAEVQCRIAKLKASLDSYAAAGGMKTSTPKVLQYYVLDGRKYPVQKGRLFKALEQYRDRGGNLADLVQAESAPIKSSIER